MGEHLELVGLDAAVRDLHPQHLVVAALALAVDALVQAEDAEGVVVDLAGEVPGDAVLEAVELVLDDGVEREGAELADVDHGVTSVVTAGHGHHVETDLRRKKARASTPAENGQGSGWVCA